MPLEIIILLAVIAILLLISVLKSEKIVKVVLWTYILLPFSMGLWEAIMQLALFLNTSPELRFLGISYQGLSEFLISAQPTVVLLLFIFLIWFVVKNSYIGILHAQDPFQKQLQALIWSVLCVGSTLSYFYFTLAYFKGEVFEYLFMSPKLLPYISWFPIIGFVVPLLVILASSRIQFRLFKKQIPELE